MDRFLLLFLALTITGCAYQEAEAARQSYESCLLSNTKNTNACESQRLIYEMNRQRISDIHMGMGGLTPPPPDVDPPRAWMMNQNGRTYLCNNYGGAVNCN